jgi:hypothetical protein
MRYLFRFQFAEADRETYGAGTYELDCSPDGLGRVPMALLEEFEDATGMRVLGDWLDRLGGMELKAIRAFMWLAVRVAGDPTADFGEFTPNVLAAQFSYVPDAEGNGASPGPNRATRRTASRQRSANSSGAAPRRRSAS